MLRQYKQLLVISLLGWFITGCGSREPRPGYNRLTGRIVNKGSPAKAGMEEVGMISYYGPGFHGKKTANGEIFNQHALTAAHKTFPFNTKLRVTLISTGKSIIVRVNDRGPFKKGRILDLSLGAAKKIGLIKSGTAKARIVVL